MVHMSRSEQKRITSQKKKRIRKPATPYRREKQEKRSYDCISEGGANETK